MLYALLSASSSLGCLMYPTWDSAVAGGAPRGVSAAFDYIPPPFPTTLPPDVWSMYGLRAFVAPEPSTLAVGVLGLVGLFFSLADGSHRRIGAAMPSANAKVNDSPVPGI